MWQKGSPVFKIPFKFIRAASSSRCRREQTHLFLSHRTNLKGYQKSEKRYSPQKLNRIEQNYQQMKRGKADTLSGWRREGGNYTLEYERKEL